jgi:hypothetical protein
MTGRRAPGGGRGGGGGGAGGRAGSMTRGALVDEVARHER